MIDEKEKTVLNSSVGADEGQSVSKSNFSIAENNVECNTQKKTLEELTRELKRINNPNFLPTIAMTELYENVYESKPAIIDKLLFPGTYIFAGAPKLGKSFLMVQIAYHVATGLPLWDFSVKKSAVLYFALEDTYARLQQRLFNMFGVESTENLFFAVSSKQIGGGLNEQIRWFIREHPNLGLIIIDTLQKVRESSGEGYSYANDYEIIAKIKSIADEFGICIITVHHTRKQHADDKFDMISGTNGLLGAADGAFLLQKENRTSNASTLAIAGRDQQDQKLYLNRNPETLSWDLERVETELWQSPPDPFLEEIKKLLSENNGAWSGTATQLREQIATELTPISISMKLNILSSRLKNDYKISYERIRNHSGRLIKLSLIEPSP